MEETHRSDTGRAGDPGAGAAPPAGRGTAWRPVRELAETLLLAALLFFAVRGVVQSFRVEGTSMVPSLQPEELLLVNRAAFWRIEDGLPLSFLARGSATGDGGRYVFGGPKRGEVIVFAAPRDPGRDYIKRVVGVPGDRIEIRDGRVWCNGEALSEPYVGGAPTETDVWQARDRGWVVPAGHLFVLGDNRQESSDSRSWGYVPVGNVIGEAVFSYWPVNEVGGIPAAAAPQLPAGGGRGD